MVINVCQNPQFKKKVIGNLDIDPREMFKFAKTESIHWDEAQVLNTQRTTQNVDVVNLPSTPG